MVSCDIIREGEVFATNPAIIGTSVFARIMRLHKDTDPVCFLQNPALVEIHDAQTEDPDPFSILCESGFRGKGILEIDLVVP